jgi:hypothetical protein
MERSSSIVEVGPESPSLPMNYLSQKHKVKQPDPYDFNDDEQSINPATVSKRMFRSSRDDFLNKRMVCALNCFDLLLHYILRDIKYLGRIFPTVTLNFHFMFFNFSFFLLLNFQKRKL